MSKKTTKGGGTIDLALGFVFYVLDVISSVFISIAQFFNENSIQFLYYMLFLGTYVMCFYFLQFTTTTIPCIVLLLILHCIFLFMMLVIKVKMPILEKNATWNFGNFSIYMVSVGWIFILIALAFLLKTYTELYKAFIPNGVDIQFGDAEPSRKMLITTLIYASIFMWGFYTLEYLKTNDVLLLNVFFVAFALFMVLYAMYNFIFLNIINGVFSTIISFVSMIMVKYIQENAVDFEHFFTRNTLANYVILLLGVIFNIIAIKAYYLSSTIATTMGTIQIPQIIQLNPTYHEGMIIQIDGDSCDFVPVHPICQLLLHKSDLKVDPEIIKQCCKPIPTPTPGTPMPTTIPPPNVQDAVMNLWYNRDHLTTYPPSYYDLKKSSSEYIPINSTLTPTTKPTLSATTIIPKVSNTIQPISTPNSSSS
jgi:hypothetical protein